MIKLSRMSDYAVVVLEALSRQETKEQGASLAASQIAIESLLPEPTVAKVLKLMSAGGLVTSQRGASGGYTLNRTAQEITVYDIITAIEGRLGLTACVEGGTDEPCALHGSCTMSGRWDLVNDAVSKAFKGITLADMMNQRKAA